MTASLRMGAILAFLAFALSGATAAADPGEGYAWRAWRHNASGWYAGIGWTFLDSREAELELLAFQIPLVPWAPPLLGGASFLGLSMDVQALACRVWLGEFTLALMLLDLTWDDAMPNGVFNSSLIISDMLHAALTPLAASFSSSGAWYEPRLRMGNDLSIQGRWLLGSLVLTTDWIVAFPFRGGGPAVARNGFALTLSWRLGGLLFLTA